MFILVSSDDEYNRVKIVASVKTINKTIFNLDIDFLLYLFELQHGFHIFICDLSIAALMLQNFGFDGKLIVNYACSMAWG